MSGALAAVGLRDAGCEVTVLAATGGRGAHRGRGIEWALGPRLDDPTLFDAVDAAIRRRDIDLVYAATEPARWRLEDAAPRLSAPAWPPADPGSASILRDKRETSALVAASGVSIPEQRDLGSSAAGADLLALGIPVVVKGARGRGGSATRIAASIPAARAAVREITGRGIPCFLQRYVAGETWLAGGVFDAGRPLRWYCGVKRVQQPPGTGPAAVIESAHDDALDEIARRVFAAARVSGLASADFIRDRDGRFHFLELNPRPWGSLAAAAEAGVDLFAPLAALMAGESPPADLRYRAGVRTTVLPLYLLSARCWLSGEALGSLRRDLRGAQGAPWREPLQAMHLLARLARVWRNWEAGERGERRAVGSRDARHADGRLERQPPAIRREGRGD